MKSHKKVLFLLMATVFAADSLWAQENDDFGTWTDFQATKSWKRAYVSFRAEYRSNQNVQSLDCWFLRPTVGIKITPWLKFDVGYDFFNKPSTVQHRILPSLTATLKEGNLTVSLRERYTLIYSPSTEACSHLLRSQLKAQYAIPESRFKPYLAVEVFTWKNWQKTRHYVGTLFHIAEHHELDLFYMYYTFDDKPSEHVLGLGYHISL